MTSDADLVHMRRAIALARTHVGLTGENPSVGCVLVKDGVIVGEGVTAEGGRPHAEEQAIEKAGDLARGAVAYVTLEPCGARSSGAASCSQRLVSAGVAEVVIACEDASPYASGQGAERLAGAGVLLRLGVLADEAAGLYETYQPPRN
ncbi:diaminohydroxyphosphoribosylaminopyrimidine deaminase/5-amino-6-(5-phosphoribosylamino)uracil reductase [Phenylobacterium haematophilum]|jgi:diaminohydroxyphosphoribosylaminopyrimidine deaminase/5-amino-6-(5-phosphoribosylamino)uracil reductase|uniref:Diaminohydroxyphosphoribosylaminopyrimidine deaminase/5-amino-6-(5-phosphoribosylamino)uracil reductase n=1 Tax=Phenylobacterium haematophilum TaxID=98513 RepID=A0A840A143_9CAUL|nr:bifunctional diaminohydroxyphosphoribosylaminopyrimidine deaminase/5-amino-6-(5-phosphoribosylamino)uracil reductase RibD [Phenylobacterium haematophilum]MBB3891190.1 diaminohydroxyphosphoribosylaminopyrimidine deaminase/5-amino-6-(5-phosphoribosylamino)uracil reductase [Phenylobacterium haematophilum]